MRESADGAEDDVAVVVVVGAVDLLDCVGVWLWLWLELLAALSAWLKLGIN